MNRQLTLLILSGLLFFFQACSKDALKQYEGDFTFRTKVTEYYKSGVTSRDTIIHSTGTITEMDKSTLRIIYGTEIQGGSRSDFFLLAQADVKVDDDGYISPADENLNYDLSITGRFYGADSLSMVIDVGDGQYGIITTNAVDGKRSR